MKIYLNDDKNISFIDKCNPFSTRMPFVILTSHHIHYNEKEKSSEFYNCDKFIASLNYGTTSN